MLCVGTARGELWLSSWRRTQRRGRRGGWGGESYTFALISVLRPGLHFGFGCGHGFFWSWSLTLGRLFGFGAIVVFFGFGPGLGFG